MRSEAERLMTSHHWTEEAALWTRGEKVLEDTGIMAKPDSYSYPHVLSVFQF